MQRVEETVPEQVFSILLRLNLQTSLEEYVFQQAEVKHEQNGQCCNSLNFLLLRGIACFFAATGGDGQVPVPSQLSPIDNGGLADTILCNKTVVILGKSAQTASIHKGEELPRDLIGTLANRHQQLKPIETFLQPVARLHAFEVEAEEPRALEHLLDE